MKVLAYYPLHYGKEYFKESLLSIKNHVDKILVLYTPKPSYGHGTDIECPETEQELLKIAIDTCGSDKIIWENKVYGYEGQHRSDALSYSERYDLLLAVDADEVWKEDSLVECLNEALRSEQKYIGISGFVNFWKNFNYECKDFFTPIRITNLRNEGREMKVLNGIIYHFSCAQNYDIIKYKWKIHGHFDELRKDWFDKYEKWNYDNQIQDLHPTSIGLWNAVWFDKTTLPEILKQHPNYEKSMI